MDQLQIFADKISTFHQQCDDRHRGIERQFHVLQKQMENFNRTIHGETGDNGLKSLLVRNIDKTESLHEAIAEVEVKLHETDLRTWKILVAIVGAGGLGGAISQLILHL